MTERNAGVLRGRVHLVALAALICALLAAAALPAFASAALAIEVDSAGDAPQIPTSPSCDTGGPAGESCTLRAAIEVADATPGHDVITFSGVVFDGTHQIEPATPLPTITDAVTISGGSVSHGSYSGPSVGVTIPTGDTGLRVQANGVTVEHVAFGGGDSGIEVLAGSERFVATGDWFGLLADGTPAPIDLEGAGIALGPNADDATIGGGADEAETRNVFTNSGTGIEVIGASKTKILGNYVGVGPDGAGPATVVMGVVVSDGLTTKAEETEVGGVLSPDEAATPACDGPCNVIATEGPFYGIAILGETSGLGHRSHIRGNFIGLEADGVTPVGERSDGVIVASTSTCGGGPEVTVGGTAPTETNYIVGGATGIYAQGVENFTAAGNAIGIAADGNPSASPEGAGIGVCAEGATGTAHVTGNRMVLEGEVAGIVSSWGRADIVGNSIEGGEVGIVTNEEGEHPGDLIEGNSITKPEQGIVIEDDSNVVIGNTITRAERVGIDLEAGADHNRIGGDRPGEANTIVGSGLRGRAEDGAIVMFTHRRVRNEFAANTGFGNGGRFINLFTNPIEGELANGILPPNLGTVQQSSASGTTAPEATVRVYAKASAEPGELGAQLAKVQADASGNWQANFAKQPVGGLVAATATREGGTSEVSAPVAAAADPEEEKTGSGSSTSNPFPPAPPAKIAPRVKLTAHPKKSSTATTARFRFKVTNVSGARFECRLDRAKWARCRSPRIYRNLKARKHTFRVRAIANGFAGRVTKYRFRVKG